MPDPDYDDEAARAAAKREHTSEVKRRWREANLDRVHEQSRAWKAAHPERVRELNRRWREQHLDRSRQQNRDSARRAAARKRREAETRRKARERSKRWREEHPERVRTYQLQWVEANRDKVREYYNRYYETHREEVSARAAARRDADPERTRRASKEWAERNKERRAELQRQRRSDPKTYQAELEANAAARRLKRRLARSGLPPKRLHPTSAAERRANERDADAYFEDPSLNEHVRQLTVFGETLTEHMLEHAQTMRDFAESYANRRRRLGLPLVDIERVVYARAVDVVIAQVRRVDLLTSRDISAAVRSTQAVVRRAERRQVLERLMNAIVRHAEHNLERLTREATIETRARHLSGKPTMAFEYVIAEIAMQELLEGLASVGLVAADSRMAARAAARQIGFTLRMAGGAKAGSTILRLNR
ncbi:hypothetical protein [Agromyces bracchium]|uniref:Uncharacterized protein n=1 Tax=Agromyces bracchium TaxID=88376 RepID=A0A6I3LW25_9MICO|nr:hypothetical protein [Agromyces bracchium]MTH66760.1 hypothetical protein [Agromyces bracchium]